MKSEWILGFLLGSLLSGFAVFHLKGTEKQKRLISNNMKKILVQTRGLVAALDAEERSALIEEVLNKFHKNGIGAILILLATTGLKLWRKNHVGNNRVQLMEKKEIGYAKKSSRKTVHLRRHGGQYNRGPLSNDVHDEKRTLPSKKRDEKIAWGWRIHQTIPLKAKKQGCKNREKWTYSQTQQTKV